MVELEFVSESTVELVEFMGGDHQVVNSARVSFAGAHQDALEDGDEKLISFLMRNRHGTPFESSVFTFRIETPIFVAREWFRHRIGCLAGDSEVTCVQPNGSVYGRTIEHLYRTTKGVMMPERWIKNGRGRYRTGARKRVPTQRSRTYKEDRALRVLGDDGFSVSRMADIWESGVKPLYLLETKDGRKLRASADHRILTPDGWARVHELSSTDVVMRQGRVAVRNDTMPHRLRLAIQQWATLQRRKVIGQGADCHLCGQFFWEEDLDLDHIVPVMECLPKALDISNLAPACVECHREKTNREQPRGRRSEVGPRADRLVRKPELVSEEMTYDIEMEGPNHNYLANQIVVHNSFNELSGRYKELPPRLFLPDHARRQKGKPGAYTFELSSYLTPALHDELKTSYAVAWGAYSTLLANGVAKEQARLVLPVATMTQFYWTVNARSLMNFLSLRLDSNAMLEIRLAATDVNVAFSNEMPVTFDCFSAAGMVAP